MNLTMLAVFIGLLGYAYWNSFIDLVSYWEMPLWSHGYLVPAFAAVLLWMRWDPKALTEFDAVSAAERWCGVGVLSFGVLMRLISSWMGIEMPDMLSFVPCLAGICLMVGGWQFIKWVGPIVLFLSFMFPLPDFMVLRVLHPLQALATTSSEYVLQTLGYGVERIGNKLSFGAPGNEVEMTVVEACSGLRMMTVFLALCVAVALIIERPIWERIVIVILGAVPIAVASNVIRIAATGIIHYHFQSIPTKVIHDWAGLAMMPVGMLLLWLLVLVLSRIVVETDRPDSTVSVLGGRGGGGPGGGEPAPTSSEKSTSSRSSSSTKSSGKSSGKSSSKSRDKKSRRPSSPIRRI